MGKKQGKKGMSKQAWLDWLADEPPAPTAKSELRDRFKQQANSYQPVNRSIQAQPTVAAPQVAAQPQAVSQATPAAKPAPVPSKEAKKASDAPNATVSIQIHIPALQTERFKRLIAKVKGGFATVKAWIQVAKQWFLQQLKTNKARTLGISIGVPVAVLLLLSPVLFNIGGKPKEAAGTANGTSAGSKAKYDKPTFEVVTPSTKTKLATPDGVHAAYDGNRNTYSYSDTISGNGFTVSQQPIPPQFATGAAAVESIAPTLNKGVTPVKLKSITGTAYLSTNPKYNSQSLVINVRDVLIFIQSAHAFKATEWESYINTLQ